jgi:nitric oxide reductase NorQ protein
MKNKIYGTIVSSTSGGEAVYTVFQVDSSKDVTHLFRPDMIRLAHENNQSLEFNEETGRGKRIEMSDLPKDDVNEAPKAKVKDNDPVIAFIKNAPSIKPDTLEMSDVKWKYLVRSTVRGKNIMMVGPAGCGKTQAAKSLPEATNKPFFYFNLGSTQDPRAALIGNTHFKKGETLFDKSPFVKALETPDAIIVLVELSRAHPEAWNILMTVLDEEQRYLRLDESIDSPIIKVAEGVCFIATANIGTEYTSSRVLDRALMDRFEIIEVDILNMHQEQLLLQKRFPGLDESLIESVADIADTTRKEWRSEEGKLSTMVSTRMTVRLCDLLVDGFDLAEATQVAILPFFDPTGGSDSERTFVKQVIQKHMATEDQDIFNIEDDDSATIGKVN